MKTAWMLLVLLFSVALPAGLAVWWKRRSGLGPWPFAAGALCFVLFAQVLEPACHYVFLIADSPLSRTINGSTVLYALYGALAAGLFEETGRLFGFRVLLKKQRKKETSVAYGIGHGGIEVLLLLGVTYLMYLLAASGVSFGDAADAALAASAESITPGTALLVMFERLFALAFHIGLSVLVFAAARERGKGWLYPAAIGLHALADFPAVLYQRGVLPIWAVEIWLALAAAGLGWLALRLYRALPGEETGG